MGLDDEDAPSGGGGGLADRVAVLHECVEAGVAADAVLAPWDVVGDGGWEEDHGDAEGGVFLAGFAQLADGGEGFEAADNKKGVESVELEAFRCCVEVFVGKPAVGPDFGAAFVRPALDVKPADVAHGADGFVCVMSAKTWEAVVDCYWLVAACQAVSDGCAGGGVHATCWCSDMNDCDPHAFVLGENEVWLVGFGGHVVSAVVLSELSVAKLHGSVEIPSFDSRGYRLGRLDCLDQWFPYDLILYDRNDWCWCLWFRIEDSLDSLDPLKC